MGTPTAATLPTYLVSAGRSSEGEATQGHLCMWETLRSRHLQGWGGGASGRKFSSRRDSLNTVPRDPV